MEGSDLLKVLLTSLGGWKCAITEFGRQFMMITLMRMTPRWPVGSLATPLKVQLSTVTYKDS